MTLNVKNIKLTTLFKNKFVPNKNIKYKFHTYEKMAGLNHYLKNHKNKRNRT